MDDERFAAFVAARMGALLSFAHVLTGDPDAAEDLVQTALTKTAPAWTRVERKDDPEAYVRRVLVTTSLNSWRRARRHPETSVADPPERPGPPGSGVEERDAMWRALAGLPPRQRAVLVLRYYEDLSEEAIADVLRCSRGTVKRSAARALVNLRGQLTVREEVPR